MKHINIFLSALLGLSIPAIVKAEIVDISTPNTSLILDAEKGGSLRLLHYGNKMASSDIAALKEAGAIDRNAYPVYGILPQGEAAMSVTHADGNMTTDVEVTGIDTTTAPDGAKVTTISMRDKVYPFNLNVNYRTYPEEDVIETWVDVTNNEKGTVRLNRFMSGYLPVRYGDVWLSQLYGSWANEGKLSQTPLNHGVRMIKNKDGVRNSHTSHAEIMLSLDGKPQENTGRTIGAALEYSGNYKLFIDTDDSNYHHFFAGINEENSAYNLKKGESFVTPPLALTYS
ncbi:MAG: alpha-galactosidase, partial [Duncaniella sp.]|nr:alpha-galactosidase [Duncaniella sp.]